MVSRRKFIQQAGAAAAFSIVPRFVLGGKGFIAPSDTLYIAGIGVGGKGTSDLTECAKSPNVKVVFLCDVDDRQAVKSKENFQLIYELAHTIGGEIGGSRAAVDAGFVPQERQIGQTGVTVRPKLYFAIGISGAIQHRAGMQESKKIIAINTDPDAPIFDFCHYGIVGDAMEVIPKFIEIYKSKLK